MWYIYDEYDDSATVIAEFHTLADAGDWVEQSDDPLTYRIGYRD